MMYELHHLRVRSVAKVVAILTFVGYLFIGCFTTVSYGLVRLFFGSGALLSRLTTMSFLLVWLAAGLGVLLFGYLIGIILAAVYNATARWWGGIEFTLSSTHDHGKKE